MKVELICKTVKIAGTKYYYVQVDGDMQSGTWTTEPEKAQESFKEVCVKCVAFPEDKIEVIKSETI